MAMPMLLHCVPLSQHTTKLRLWIPADGVPVALALALAASRTQIISSLSSVIGCPHVHCLSPVARSPARPLARCPQPVRWLVKHHVAAKGTGYSVCGPIWRHPMQRPFVRPALPAGRGCCLLPLPQPPPLPVGLQKFVST
ncbi:hypothetical protein AWZ03_013102 [Drosophila navojoa]|uniref:Uncharacterized protein n=1 Tax=Drosophila navojoa TaxID=7232 RepID=A0A484AVN0_DRONA|nr:hypothetical protein AWZ03_013102 [Drosophila navojoa]